MARRLIAAAVLVAGCSSVPEAPAIVRCPANLPHADNVQCPDVDVSKPQGLEELTAAHLRLQAAYLRCRAWRDVVRRTWEACA